MKLLAGHPIYLHAVICPEHGVVELNLEQYEHQLSVPSRPWTCPVCGGAAKWDKNCLATEADEDAIY